jgi:hypothetical protein
MGAAVSSNFSEQASSASTSFSTDIKQESKAAQSAQNTASQECKDMKIIAKGDGTVVEACNNKVSQGITAKQLQETIQDAQIQNESYQSLQQKMSQAAKSVVKGFNFGAYAEAKNTVKQSMNASATISNDISQECGASSSGVNEAFQKCEKSEIVATDGAAVRMCNMEVEQKIIMEQVAKCQQDSKVTNKVTQDLSQKAEQTAVAEAIGIDPMSIYMLAGIIVLVAVIIFGKTVSNTFSQLMNAKNVIGLVGTGGVVAGCAMYILSALDAKKYDDPVLYQAQMLATAYPGDGQFIKAADLTDADIQDFANYCSTQTSKNACLNKNEEICEWSFKDGTCNIKTGLVGYPYKFRTDALAEEVNGACEDDLDCSGWRWDAEEAQINAGNTIITQPLPVHSKTFGKQVASFLTGKGEAEDGYDRSACWNDGNVKQPLCDEACPSNQFADVRDACGVYTVDGERRFVPTKDVCESSSHNRPFTVNQDNAGEQTCTVPGCRWDQNIKQCVNKGNAKGWKCKEYNCTQCKEGDPTGTGIMYTREFGGLPVIPEAKWSPDIWKRYATGVGGSSTAVTPTEMGSMQCARFTKFGAVKIAPKGLSKEGNDLRQTAGLYVGCAGLAMVIIFALMAILSRKKK